MDFLIFISLIADCTLLELQQIFAPASPILIRKGNKWTQHGKATSIRKKVQDETMKMHRTWLFVFGIVSWENLHESPWERMKYLS